MRESKKLEYYVEGMHCKACELYIEKQALEVKGIKKVNAVLSKNKIFIETNKNADEENIIKEINKSIKPLSYFHVSRIISFFILGGIIGIIGSSFTLSSGTSFAFSLLVFFVMLILGINLLDIFPFFRKLQLTLPKFLTKKNSTLESTENKLAPVLFGISNVLFFFVKNF